MRLSFPCVFLKLSVSIILDILRDCVLGARVQDLQMVLNSQRSVFLPSSWGKSQCVAQETRRNNGSSGYLVMCQLVNGVYSLQEARVPPKEKTTHIRRDLFTARPKGHALVLGTAVSLLVQSLGYHSRYERRPQTCGSLVVKSRTPSHGSLSPECIKILPELIKSDSQAHQDVFVDFS